MVVSLHKLTAGSGYDYLTRQVAAHDTTEKGHATLASYYSERGEAPGSWRGRGLAGLGDLSVGDVVTAEQMSALFGAGFHPNMQARLSALPSDATKAMVTEAARLGQPFPVHGAVNEFRLEVEKRTAAWRVSEGVPTTATVPTDVRADIVNHVARETFEARIGRLPTTPELGAEVSRLSREPSTACAGFDMTFTPVKSVSALWAIAPRDVAEAIERAHDAAVDDALRFLEDEALYSRAGHAGVRQIDVRGLIAASFTHRDSRAGDPNLHTHVAIANKVQGLDGKWRSIDGRLIYQARVAVSETYNTQLEAHLREALGLEFVEREPGTLERRAVREVVGIPSELVELWSSRRALIESRQSELAAEFQTRHDRPPTPAEAIRLAQQATLETRDAKHPPRSHEEQRRTWRAQAEAAIGVAGIGRALAHSLGRATTSRVDITEVLLDRVAGEVVDRVARSRASWQVWHLRGEASRRSRELATTSNQAELLTTELLDRALAISVPLTVVGDGIEEPPELRRVDGSSMYEVAGSRLYTSPAVLDAERRIVAAGSLAAGRQAPDFAVEIALLESTANGVSLNDGQARLVRAMATSGAQLQLGLAAAGTGKTTAMRVLTRAWEESGGRVLGLAPSAAAAAVLAEATGDATTIAKLLWDLHHGDSDQVDAATLIIVDEAGMADTLSLAELLDFALPRGACVRLIGDDRQLSAIGAGGVMRDLRRVHGAVELDEVLRFVDNGEKAASLALRQGDPTALGWYLDHDRIHAGSSETALDGALQAWKADTDRGLDSLMLASTRQDVAELNRRARQLLLPEDALAVALSDGNLAGVGDVILTRRNDRRLRTSTTGFVMNGDRWIVQTVNRDGGLLVRHRTTGHRAWLPAAYVADHTELGYATTIHTAQGSTVDTAHTVLSGTESRQLLYVAMTRGRQANHSYVTTVGQGDPHSAFVPETLRPPTAVEILESVLARDGAARSVTSDIAHAHDAAVRLADAVNRYRDALTVALEHRHAPELEILDHGADDVVPGLTDANAWPTLRHRLLAATDGTAPLDDLRRIAAGHRFEDIADPAASLATLIPEPTGGPLPWLPRIPASLADDERWGPYLTARAQHVTSLAAQVRLDALQAPTPTWAPSDTNLPQHLLGDVAVWRAATDVDPEDRHPTGGRAQDGSARHYQNQLDRELLTAIPSLGVAQLRALGQGLDHDPGVIGLARHLTLLGERGIPAGALVANALAEGPLPAERPAAALYWRILQRQTDAEPSVAYTVEPHVDQPSSRPRPEHLRRPSRHTGGPRR
ncbi:hypothetical protein BCR15_11520 [Tessaracoccus lapidicaptus]|uniref:Uncharacterized protein n=1 Tax=Tessaracoccus lapidicaptus TaxID=1427523 RepID=A0A1C0AS57_9ACTN|nr:hypothetical protein BCR15_11520 [Tessaracoccus lapidicaptus]